MHYWFSGDHDKAIELAESAIYEDGLKDRNTYTNICCYYLKEGKNVVFLTLGDTTVYSTYLYVHKRILERGYEAEIVSGITSFCAVAARLNMGLVEADQPLHVIPATYKAQEMDEILKLPGTKVLMKTGKKMKQVKESIEKSGQKAVMIENCGMPSEKIYRSAEEIPEDSGYYSLIIVKEN